jgi:hypothetical protein
MYHKLTVTEIQADQDLMHNPSSIHQKDLSCDEITLIRSEEDECSNNVFGLFPKP